MHGEFPAVMSTAKERAQLKGSMNQVRSRLMTLAPKRARSLIQQRQRSKR